jgi:anti-sigma B factor antagonist
MFFPALARISFRAGHAMRVASGRVITLGRKPATLEMAVAIYRVLTPFARPASIIRRMDQTLEIIEIGAVDATSTILRLKGPLLISNLFDFQNKVRGCKAAELILDMTDVPYIDSAAMGVLVGAYVSRQKTGGQLLLVGVTPRVRAVLQVTQVERFFKFADRVPEGASGA